MFTKKSGVGNLTIKWFICGSALTTVSKRNYCTQKFHIAQCLQHVNFEIYSDKNVVKKSLTITQLLDISSAKYSSWQEMRAVLFRKACSNSLYWLCNYLSEGKTCNVISLSSACYSLVIFCHISCILFPTQVCTWLHWPISMHSLRKWQFAWVLMKNSDQIIACFSWIKHRDWSQLAVNKKLWSKLFYEWNLTVLSPINSFWEY